ncbi:universal stress protein [Halococcus sp. IIIV-5B]|uniref:universal stress protein n=1 Tax=Halococcus sp. IIIV-5B TaxID=2321230 RepID=UPI000E722937|nr:universal stress protein [Halococcus sp. IIIV-5B]RJT07072.1 universal stress protein [Halococcus sp. IIIV-5B]
MSTTNLADEHILVPIDGAVASEHALEYATQFPAAEITLLTVIDPYDIDPVSSGLQSPVGRAGMPGYSEEWYQRIKDQVSEMHSQLVEQSGLDKSTVSTLIKFGSPTRQIVACVDEHEIDHVIMGNRGEDRLSRILLGSVTEGTIRRTTAVVTVIQ